MRLSQHVILALATVLLATALQTGCNGPPLITDLTDGLHAYRGALPSHKSFTPACQSSLEKAIYHFERHYKNMKDAGNPGDVGALIHLINSHKCLARQLKKWRMKDHGKEHFEKALQWAYVLQIYHHGREGSYYYMGQIYYYMEEYEKAEKELQEDLKIRPREKTSGHLSRQDSIDLLRNVRIKLEEKRRNVRPDKTPPDKQEKPGK